MVFSASDDEINSNIVGKFVLNDKLCDIYIREIFQSPNFKSQDLRSTTSNICIFPNRRLLFCNYEIQDLTLFDENLNFIKSINLIDNKKFKCAIAVTNAKDRVYIANDTNNEIILTDLEFNKIKSFDLLQSIQAREKLVFIRGLCYVNECLYVSDYQNKCIQKLNSNLEFISVHHLDYNPWKIEVSNQVICVQSYIIEFYDVNTFDLKHKYEGHNGSIAKFNSHFYEYYHKKGKLFCYDKNGYLNETIVMNRQFNNLFVNSMGSFGYFCGKFFISSWNSNKLVIIDGKL